MSKVTLDGNPLEISGTFPQPGNTAPDFTLTAQGLEETPLSAYAGKRKNLHNIPSIAPGVGDASPPQVNEQAQNRDKAVELEVYADLPFAAGRFCGAEGLKDVITLSTFRNYSFQEDYGVAIQNGPLAGLCARAVVVLDENNTVLHSELVAEIKQEPDYEAALAVL